MTLYWKAAGGILISLVLWITLQKQEKDMSLLLSLAVCILGTTVLSSFLEPVISLMRELEALSGLQDGILGRLLKVLGIGLTGEITALLCLDAGNAAMGKLAGLLSTGAMLYLSIPMIRALIELIQEILGFL